MKYIWISIGALLLISLAVFLMQPSPTSAGSERAQRFLLACQQLDRPFPPADWSDADLRAAALEVLNNYESTGSDQWAVYFCLQALGHTRVGEDVPRILKYGDSMTLEVLRALRGWPSTEAVEFMIEKLGSEQPASRELAVKGLREVDYSQLPEGYGDR